MDNKLLQEIFITKINDSELDQGYTFNNEVDIKLWQKIDFKEFSYDQLNLDSYVIEKMKEANITLYPQKIYEKDLSEWDFEGIKFSGPFKGCDIKWASFDGSEGAIINPQDIKGKNLSGVSLGNVKIKGSLKDCRFDSETSFKGATIICHYSDVNYIEQIKQTNPSIMDAKIIIEEDEFEKYVKDSIFVEMESQKVLKLEK